MHKRYSKQNWDGKKVFMEPKKLFMGKMNLELKKRIMKCLVWSIALYAAETWTLTRTDRRRLEAREMWIWRRMENSKLFSRLDLGLMLSMVMITLVQNCNVS